MSEAEEQLKQNSSRERRKRRRKRRMIYIALFLLISYAFVWVLQQRATTTVLFVRSAEAIEGNEDASLTPAGKSRAEALVGALNGVGSAEGSVAAIYVSPDRSARETVAPLADNEDLYAEVVDMRDIPALKDRVLDAHKGEIILMVAAGNDVEDLVEEFQGGYPIDAVGDERDNIFVVSIPWFGKERLLRFKYGNPEYISEPLPAVLSPDFSTPGTAGSIPAESGLQ